MTPEETIAAIRADARFAAATAKLGADLAPICEACLTLPPISAPHFAEEARSAAYLPLLRSHGLGD